MLSRPFLWPCLTQPWTLQSLLIRSSMLGPTGVGNWGPAAPATTPYPPLPSHLVPALILVLGNPAHETLSGSFKTILSPCDTARPGWNKSNYMRGCRVFQESSVCNFWHVWACRTLRLRLLAQKLSRGPQRSAQRAGDPLAPNLLILLLVSPLPQQPLRSLNKET